MILRYDCTDCGRQMGWIAVWWFKDKPYCESCEYKAALALRQR